ncbi:urease accessory protein UreD [Celeribacter marinus]|uniref:urease accessory protein UreD n=1 Tax=Celeribacter marinus TaxID=1397108 RepID=UPI0031738006
MLDSHLTSDAPRHAAPMQRVRGVARVVMGATGLRDLYQAGSAKAMLPKIHGPVPEVVFLNTSGGLTAGDRLDYTLEVEAGGALVGTSQTAERAYASVAQGADAEVAISLKAGCGARLDWLPQETILFDKSRLSRVTRAQIAADSRFVFVESLVLGRAAMGETVESLRFRDRREVHRAGRLEYLEPLEFDADTLAMRHHAVTLGGARAIATIGVFAQGAQDLADSLKSLTQEGVSAGVSGWNGKLIIRAMAADGYPLRRYVARALEHLRHGPLPRVWQL